MKNNWRTLGVTWFIDEHNKDVRLQIPDIAGLVRLMFYQKRLKLLWNLV